MDPGRTPARGASIRLIPPDEGDPFVEPSKSQLGTSSSNNAFAPAARLAATRSGQQEFRFGFNSPAVPSPPSPAVGESALSPPEPSKSRFSASTILSPEQTRTSSFAIPWHPPIDPSTSRFSKETSSPELARLSLPDEPRVSRFSSTTSSRPESPSPAPTPTSPPAQSFFSPTVDEEASPRTPHYPIPSRSHFSTTTVESPPPLPPRSDRPYSPPTPSQWQAFFASPQPNYVSHFSASTTSPPEASPPSPPSTADSGSSSSSMDGTTPSALPDIPAAAFYNQPNRRIYSSTSSRYSHPFPTTDLSVIDEDEVYPYSPATPPTIPRRTSSRPFTADRETQTSDSLELGAAAAVAFAAGGLPPPEPARLPPLPPIPSSITASMVSAGKRVSIPPQLPPLPPFNHSTSSLQRYFSYFPTPDPNASPVIGPDGQARSPNPSIVTFGSVTGPRGERFSALREKRKSRGVYWPDGTPKRRFCGVRGMTRKLWMILLIIAFVAMTVIAIGLGIGLTRNNGNNDGQGQAGGNGADNGGNDGAGNGDANNTEPVFPAGVFSITTNLLNVSTACTNISETWSCAPGQTLQQAGVNASQEGLTWTISQNNLTAESDDDDGFSISNVDNPFGLKFNNTPLTLREEGTENEHWGFEVRVNKRVKPNRDITGNNIAVECEYSQAQLAGRLFTRRQADPEFQDGEGSWPGAVEAEESSEIEGECFEVRNGVRGDRVDVGAGSGECSCSYGDSEPG